jgi:hypothetical protein
MTAAGVRVVGITGAARHGKDELARALVSVVPGAERFAFSDAVAAVARAEGRMVARDARVLQAVGTERRRARPSVWLECLEGAIRDRRPVLAVVTGVRYPDEFALIESLGGVVVGVVRPGAPALTDRDAGHEVESHVPALLARCGARVVTVPELSDDDARAVFFRRLAVSVASEVASCIGL